MKKIIAGIVFIVCLLGMSDTVSAHVLVTDETKTRGAVLHIIPDDDPVAGEKATLYFDMQEEFSESKAAVTLYVKDENGKEKNVDTKANGSLVTADYVFPAQGSYGITYTVISGDKTYVFNQAQRVSRGASSTTSNKPNHAWAEIMLIASAISIAVLAIIAFNLRKDIAKQSTF